MSNKAFRGSIYNDFGGVYPVCLEIRVEWLGTGAMEDIFMQKPSTRLSLATFAGVALVAALAVPAHAHHGWGGNATEESELTGTVELLSVSGPHATMKLRVGEQLWDITLAPPARAQRAGLRANVIPIGATVTVTAFLAKDGRKIANANQVTLPDGQLMFAGSSGTGAPSDPTRAPGR